MRIAIIDDLFYPFFRGGAERRYFDIYRKVALKHEVHWFTTKFDKMPSNDFVYENIHVHCVMKAPDNFYTSGRRKISPALIFAFLVFRKIWNYDFEFIDSDQFPFWHNFLLLFYARIKKIKMFVTWMEVWNWTYWRNYLGSFGGTLGYLIQFLLAKFSKNNICISELTCSNLKKFRSKHQHLWIIPGGTDISLLSRLKKPFEEKQDRIITIGRLIPEKNFSLLVKVVSPFLRKNHSYSLLIIGKGPEEENIKKIILELELEDRIILDSGEYDYCHLMRTLTESKALISLSHREGFGLVLVEAQALDVVPITNDYKDNAGRFLIKDKNNGFIVKADGSNLAYLLERVFISEGIDFIQRILENSRINAEKYDYDIISSELLSKINKLL